MYKLENFTLLQNLCDVDKEIKVDPDSREILKMMGLLHSFWDCVGEYDDGEDYDEISELLAPVFEKLDSMLIQHITRLFHESKKK